MYQATLSGRKAGIILPILQARKAKNLLSKYSEAKIGKAMKGDRLYGTFNQIGAGTARYSSKDPNLQQIPRAMRNIIGGEEGYQVVAPDYSQIEVRIKALVAHDSDMVAALQADDFHTLMASKMFPGRAITTELRTLGKGGTFTINFDGGAPGIQKAAIKEGEIILRDTALKMVKGYRKAFPKSEKFNQIFRDRAKTKRPQRINLPWGHYRTYPTATSQQMINNIVQGYAAIGYKEGLLEMDRRGLVGSYLGCFLHDEVVCTGVPEKEAAEYCAEVEEALLVGMNRIVEDYGQGFTVPVVIEGKRGSHWTK